MVDIVVVEKQIGSATNSTIIWSLSDHCPYHTIVQSQTLHSFLDLEHKRDNFFIRFCFKLIIKGNNYYEKKVSKSNHNWQLQNQIGEFKRDIIFYKGMKNENLINIIPIMKHLVQFMISISYHIIFWHTDIFIPCFPYNILSFNKNYIQICQIF